MTGKSGAGGRNGERTVLGYGRADLLVLFAGAPAFGMVLALALPFLARWANDWPVAPMRGPIRFLAAIDEPWEIATSLACGLVAGLLFGLVALSETMKLTLTDTEVLIEHNDRPRTIPRADVEAVFLQGKKLVITGHNAQRLIRAEHQSSADAVARAFQAHGYPWRDKVPSDD